MEIAYNPYTKIHFQMNKNEIKFLRKKDYKLIKEIGQGGLGKTILLKDEIIDEQFICKKYSPISDVFKEKYFNNFLDEIKLLHKVYHINIVRVFNYYLYPEKLTGYILMEYVNGENIKNFSSQNPHLIANLFEQTITGFCHLEENQILHRDIRPDNILVSNDGILKIIDFGFGKQINFEENFNKSISINWRFQPPKDFENKTYDFRTEIYFIGKLFEEILRENQIEDFLYKDIISEMVKLEYIERITDFETIHRRILSREDFETEFSNKQKEIYKDFAYSITNIFSKIETSTNYSNDIGKIIKGLEVISRDSLLEDYVQNPVSIAREFVSANYRYFKNVKFSVSTLNNFIKLLKSVSIDKQKIILNNLWQRLDTIERYTEYKDDLPF